MMTGIKNPNTQEVAHDEKLLELVREVHTYEARIKNLSETLFVRIMHFVPANIKQARQGRGVVFLEDGEVPLTNERVVEIARDMAKWDDRGKEAIEAGVVDEANVIFMSGIGRIVERYEKVANELREARIAIDDHEQGYTGWQRYFLVTSTPGHVHRTMRCHTTFATTTFAPLPFLAGLGDEEAVYMLGETLCTVCFPEAPVNRLHKLTKKDGETLLEDGTEAFLKRMEGRRAKGKADRCEGSGTADYDQATVTTGIWSNAAICRHCNNRRALTTRGALRAHGPN